MSYSEIEKLVDDIAQNLVFVDWSHLDSLDGLPEKFGDLAAMPREAGLEDEAAYCGLAAGVAGCAIMSDGNVALILDIAGLVRVAHATDVTVDRISTKETKSPASAMVDDLVETVVDAEVVEAVEITDDLEQINAATPENSPVTVEV